MDKYSVEFLREQLEKDFDIMLKLFSGGYRSLSKDKKENFITALRGYIDKHPEVKEGYALRPENLLMIYANEELLKKSFENDFKLTFYVINRDGTLPKGYRDVLKEYVKENNIVVDDTNYNELMYDDFLLDSLNNDYEQTIKNVELLGRKQLRPQTSLSYDNEEEFNKLLREHGFNINKETFSAVKENGCFLEYIHKYYDECLENDTLDEKFPLESQVYLALGCWRLSDGELLEGLKNNEAYEIFVNDSRLTTNVVFGMSNIENLKELGENKVLRIFENIKINRLRNDILENEYFIKNGLGTQVNDEQIKIVQQILQGEYSNKHEKDFLNIYDIDNLEEYVIAMMKSNMQIKDLSLYQRAAVQLYSNKLLKQKGVDNVKTIFNNEPTEQELGYFDKTKNVIIINMAGVDGVGSIEENTLRNVVETIHHEINHAIQDTNTKQARFENDMDVFVYVKEDFLKENVSEYYTENYARIKKEFDADMKAKLEVAEILGEIDDLFDRCVGEFEKTIQSEQYQQVQSRVGYLDTNIRRYKGNKKGFETLFQEQLEESLKYKGAEEIKEKYPMIAIGYDLNNKGKMRSLEEMLEIINNSNNDKVKNICWGIILDRFNPERYVKEEGFDEQEMLGYDDYGLLERYNFKSEYDRKKASKIAEKLEKISEITKYEQYVKEIKELKEATGR